MESMELCVQEEVLLKDNHHFRPRKLRLKSMCCVKVCHNVDTLIMKV